MSFSRADRCIDLNDHGQSGGHATWREAVVGRGRDRRQRLRPGLHLEEPKPGRARSTGGYYINAAQAGEAPGRWWGPGAQALGLSPGQVGR
jgi:hypothetical protein